MDGEPINRGQYGEGYAKSGSKGCCDAAAGCDTESEYCDEIVPQGAYHSVMNDEMAPMQNIPQDVLNSESAKSGIYGVMDGMAPVGVYAESDRAYPMMAGANRPQNANQGVRNRRVTATATESIAVELGANANIADLESEWEQIYSKNEDVLKGYEPYYSVDATADGDVRELFRLRVGPVKSIRTGDTLCRKLGKRGFSCSVVRIQ